MAASRRLCLTTSWRDNIETLYTGQVPPGLEGLAKAISRFDLRKEDFFAVIDGVEMDARADIRAPSIEELDLYCDRVACAVGRLSVRVFGLEESDGKMLAHHLGRALQITNILRDIDEDAGVGRLYIPREALQLAGIDTVIPQSAVTDARLGRACTFLAERARGHFTKANEVMARCSRRSVRAPKIMRSALPIFCAAHA